MRRIGVCSWSLRPSDAGDLCAKIGACGLSGVQLALDPVREGRWKEADTVERLKDAGIAVLSGMMAMAGEEYSTLDSIKRTGGVRMDAMWPRNLAAARANVLTPAQMLDELQNRFQFLVTDRKGADGRPTTMRAAVEWSYDVLPDDLKDFFNRLSVFRGGWNLKAVREVCNARHGIDLLEHLVRRSLIVAEQQDQEMRYRMLEMLRE